MANFLDTDIFQLIIPIISMVVISLACSMLKEKGTFSMDVFLTCVSICIPVLIWTNIFPLYTIAISVMIMIGELFSGKEPVASGG